MNTNLHIHFEDEPSDGLKYGLACLCYYWNSNNLLVRLIKYLLLKLPIPSVTITEVTSDQINLN